MLSTPMYTLTYIHTYRHTYTNTYIHTQIHTYVHTYIHTYIHTKGQITKEYFSAFADRLNMKINITHNFTRMVTGQGNIRSYLHRFKILETPTCPCGTRHHLLFECELLNKERDNLISTVLKTDLLPMCKHDLIRKHFKTFAKFTNEILFDKINQKD